MITTAGMNMKMVQAHKDTEKLIGSMDQVVASLPPDSQQRRDMQTHLSVLHDLRHTLEERMVR